MCKGIGSHASVSPHSVFIWLLQYCWVSSWRCDAASLWHFSCPWTTAKGKSPSAWL